MELLEYPRISQRRWVVMALLLTGALVGVLPLWNAYYAVNFLIYGLAFAFIVVNGRSLPIIALDITIISIVFGRITVLPIYGRTPDLLYIDVFAAFAALSWMGNQALKGKRARFDIVIPAGVYVLVSIGTTLAHSQDLFREIALLKNVIMGLVLYIVAYNSIETLEDSRHMFSVFALLGIMMASDMALTFTKADLWRSVILDKTFVRFTYGRHNDIAALLEIFIFIAAGQIHKHGSLPRNIFFAFSIILMFVFLILTQSRGAMLSLALALLVGGSLVFPKKVYFKTIGLTILAGVATSLFLPKSFTVMLVNKFANLMDYNNLQRIQMWQVAWQDFLKHPFFGSGVGSTGYLIIKSLNIFSLSPHSYVFEFLAEIGLVGTITILYIFVKVITNSFVISKTGDAEIRVEYAFVLLSIIATLIDGLVEPLQRSPQYVVVFWLLAGTIAASKRIVTGPG